MQILFGQTTKEKNQRDKKATNLFKIPKKSIITPSKKIKLLTIVASASNK